MDDNFRTLYLEEKKQISDIFTEEFKTRKSVGFMSVIIISILIVLIGYAVGLAVAGPYATSAARPEFETYEKYIMSDIYKGVDMTCSRFELAIPPEDFDYESLDLDKIDRQRNIMMVNSLYVPNSYNAPGYDKVREEAKELFEKEMDRRTKERDREMLVAALKTTPVVGLLIAGLFLFYDMRIKRYKKALELLDENLVMVSDAKCIGRVVYRSRRGNRTYYLESELPNGERIEIRTTEERYENFKSGSDVLIIKWGDIRGFYDEYDMLVLKNE